MTPQEQVTVFNKNPVGSQVTYWPVLHRDGKRTTTRSEAFLSKSGTPVVFVEGVSGYVHIEHVQFGRLIDLDSPCFDENFDHRW